MFARRNGPWSRWRSNLEIEASVHVRDTEVSSLSREKNTEETYL